MRESHDWETKVFKDAEALLLKCGKPRCVDLEGSDAGKFAGSECLFELLNSRAVHVLKRLPESLYQPEDERRCRSEQTQIVRLVKTAADSGHSHRGAPSLDRYYSGVEALVEILQE